MANSPLIRAPGISRQLKFTATRMAGCSDIRGKSDSATMYSRTETLPNVLDY